MKAKVQADLHLLTSHLSQKESVNYDYPFN